MSFLSPNETDAEVSSSQTAASAIHARLRHDILGGVLKPGERLRVQDIARRYDGGTIPTREALSRLSAELLVVYLDQRGFAVAPISQESLEDLTRARVWTAQAAVREAVLQGDAAWEERVVLAYHRLSKVARYESEDPLVLNPAFDPLHREWLCSSCDVGRSIRDLALDFPTLDFAHLADPWWHHLAPFNQHGFSLEPEHLLLDRVAAFKAMIAARTEQRIAVIGHGDFFHRLLGRQLKNCELAAWQPEG